MSSTDRQRWARVPPHLAWKHPGLPTEWTRVLERNPEAMNPEPLPVVQQRATRSGWPICRGPSSHPDETYIAPATATGVKLLAAPPFPSWPAKPRPQQ
jgi:hypothetical protein